ncbi:hypothetical protein JOQ06_004039 [Pogonophryne albipinna]|uniref:Uncharacterized protein n=1 Tax=Pogonophryne albipinna TaxID=1090488 RepID=A0AAD6F624_9TELE|nr:hypothetical protein JOQ06_004039 [Pogonophryne albipinna]
MSDCRLSTEVEKGEKNLILIEKLMQTTFALRRQEIVQENPLVGDFLEKWPALRKESQVVKEMGLEGQVTGPQTAKKWDNLKTKYKVKQITWLGTVVEGPSQVSLSSEEEPVPSTSSQPPTKRPRRRSSGLAFLNKQAEKDEARDAALNEQNERLEKEDPSSYLKKRPLPCPVLIVSSSSCLLAIGDAPIATFPKQDIAVGAVYLMAYYYAFHPTYPKCVATLLSVIQTEILLDKDLTPSYKKGMAEWKAFLGQ